jgi:CheY-like chemotaxis protein
MGLAMTNRSDQPIQTLRLNDRDKAKLLWAIDQANRHDESKAARRLRVSCTNNAAVLTLKADGGSETRLCVLARNLSRFGAALVHGRYVYPDTRCELSIPSSSGMWHDLSATVRHIRHVQGTIHELGIEFDEPIELGDFVTLSPAEETRYLRELADETPEGGDREVDQLAGRILVVDDFSCDRKLFSHWLTQAGLGVMTCGDSRSALVQVQEQIFDLLIVDCCLGQEDGFELVKELREARVIAPIISVSADETPEVHAAVKASGSNAFLKKPFTKQQVTEKVFALIGVDAEEDLSPIVSTLKDDTEMRPLLTEFSRKASTYIEELREANAQANYDAVEGITRGLKGAGQGYGFPIISELAGDLLACLEASNADVDDIRKTTNELINVLNRVRLG